MELAYCPSFFSFVYLFFSLNLASDHELLFSCMYISTVYLIFHYLTFLGVHHKVPLVTLHFSGEECKHNTLTFFRR